MDLALQNDRGTGVADLTIRNGLLVDGTGAPARPADVVVDGDRIVEVTEPGQGSAGHREIDADGRLVTPGFVDIHTHYDGQATWDPEMTPSTPCTTGGFCESTTRSMEKSSP